MHSITIGSRRASVANSPNQDTQFEGITIGILPHMADLVAPALTDVAPSRRYLLSWMWTAGIIAEPSLRLGLPFVDTEKLGCAKIVTLLYGVCIAIYCGVSKPSYRFHTVALWHGDTFWITGVLYWNPAGTGAFETQTLVSDPFAHNTLTVFLLVY